MTVVGENSNTNCRNHINPAVEDALHAAPSACPSQYDMLLRFERRLQDQNQPFANLRKQLLKIVTKFLKLWEEAAWHKYLEIFTHDIQSFLKIVQEPFLCDDPMVLPRFIFSRYTLQLLANPHYDRLFRETNAFHYIEHFKCILQDTWDIFYYMIFCDLRGDIVMVMKSLERLELSLSGTFREERPDAIATRGVLHAYFEKIAACECDLERKQRPENSPHPYHENDYQYYCQQVGNNFEFSKRVSRTWQLFENDKSQARESYAFTREIQTVQPEIDALRDIVHRNRLEFLVKTHCKQLGDWFENFTRPKEYLGANDRRYESEDENQNYGHMMWDMYFSHCYQVAWPDFLEAFECYFLMEKCPLDLAQELQRQFDPHEKHIVQKKDWADLWIPKSQSCYKILIACAERVKAHYDRPLSEIFPVVNSDHPTCKFCNCLTFSDFDPRAMINRAHIFRDQETRSTNHPNGCLRLRAIRTVNSTLGVTNKMLFLRIVTGDLISHEKVISGKEYGKFRTNLEMGMTLQSVVGFQEPEILEKFSALLVTPFNSRLMDTTKFGRSSTRKTLTADWPMNEAIASRSHFSLGRLSSSIPTNEPCSFSKLILTLQ